MEQVADKHAYTLDPTKSDAVKGLVCEAIKEMRSGNCHLSGNVRPQSYQLAQQLWTDSGLKSGIGVYEPIS